MIPPFLYKSNALVHKKQQPCKRLAQWCNRGRTRQPPLKRQVELGRLGVAPHFHHGFRSHLIVRVLLPLRNLMWANLIMRLSIQLKELQLFSYHRVQGAEYAEASAWTILVDHLACDGVFPAPLCLQIVAFAFES